MAPTLHTACASSRPNAHSIERGSRLADPISIFSPCVVVRRPRLARQAEECLHKLGTLPRLRRQMRKLKIAISIKAPFAIALKSSLKRSHIRPDVIRPKAKLDMRRIRNAIVDFPLSVYPAARISAMPWLTCRTARKPVRIGAG